jgi:hypothetical protein
MVELMWNAHGIGTIASSSRWNSWPIWRSSISRGYDDVEGGYKAVTERISRTYLLDTSEIITTCKRAQPVNLCNVRPR